MKHKPVRLTQELELPEEIIQHIQSFMETKLAAKTSLLSKSWYKAWSTRPNLYFYPCEFRDDARFWDFVTKTVQRCIHLNVYVHRFHLTLNCPGQASSLVDKLIVDALKLRINALDLCFRDGCYTSPHILPAQVFANKYLTELRLTYPKIQYLVPGNVLCSNLRYLSLFHVSIDDSTFKDVLLRCPVIDRLKLSMFIKGLTRINASELLYLKTLIVEYSAFGSSPITSSVICGRFRNLSRLVLKRVSVDDSFFTNISSSFPKLVDLTLDRLYGNQNIQISSRSIKCLSLKHCAMLKMVNLDLPNIRNFEFNGNHIPPLSFTASSKEWNSIISITNFDGSDLSKLRELLIRLGRSKITLHLSPDPDRNIGPERNIENFNSPSVEELTFLVKSCEEYNLYVECIFCCRPKLVSLNFCVVYGPGAMSKQYMYKKLIERKNQNGLSTSPQNSSPVYELEEVNVELFEKSLKKWQPIKALSDDLGILNHEEDTHRFILKWGSLTPEYTIVELGQYNHTVVRYDDLEI